MSKIYLDELRLGWYAVDVRDLTLLLLCFETVLQLYYYLLLHKHLVY